MQFGTPSTTKIHIHNNKRQHSHSQRQGIPVRSLIHVIIALSAVLIFRPATAGLVSVGDYLVNDPSSLDGTLALEFGVSRAITLISGETGYVIASIHNVGTLPISFKDYDKTNSSGGFGWLFNDPGFGIGFGSVVSNGFTYTSSFEYGMVNSPQSQGPNFSHLDGVSIAPGESFEFNLYSLNLSGPTGANAWLQTYNQLNFGSPLYVGFETAQYTINISMGTVASVTAPEPLALIRSFAFTPSTQEVPEPSTLLLLSSLLPGLYIARRRKYARS
jgi:hypothetical protein